jgi:phage-related protein
MAVSVPADLLTESNTHAASDRGPWIWLVELHRDSTNVLYYARATEDVVFDSQTYTAKAMRIDPIKQDATGGTQNFKITVQNVDQVMATYLEADELRDFPAILKLVHRDHLSTASNYLEYRGYIIAADLDKQWCTLTCGNYPLRKMPIPGGRYYRERCEWVFKSDECGYAGGQTSCDKRYTTCENTMTNHDRFGGFPSLPMERP